MDKYLKKVDYNGLITQLYFNTKDGMNRLFSNMNMEDYIILHVISHFADQKEEKTEEVYVNQLAEYLNMSVAEAAGVARRLSDNGLVQWTHDPANASEGAYVKITDYGKKMIQNQSDVIKENFDYIRDNMGIEKLMMVIQTTLEIRNLLKEKNA